MCNFDPIPQASGYDVSMLRGHFNDLSNSVILQRTHHSMLPGEGIDELIYRLTHRVEQPRRVFPGRVHLLKRDLRSELSEN